MCHCVNPDNKVGEKEEGGGVVGRNEEVTAAVAGTGTFSVEPSVPRVIIKQISDGKCGAHSSA